MKRKILSMGVLPILLFALISNENTLSAQASVTVTVTNVSDVVNGNTSNIAALNSDPGPDGISFREALYASNGTAGQKTMTFHQSLSGATITFAADGELLLLSSGELTINGDIDGNGHPDITLDGHLGQDETPSGVGLSIVSSDNKLTGVNFYEFAGRAIQICCPDAQCGTRLFANNKIINNTITSQRGAGIEIGPLGLIGDQAAPHLSDIIWRGTVIQGNTITTKNDAIRFAAAVGGGDTNQMLNLTISNNYLSSQALHAIDGIVADVSSDYFGLPDPINYSDHNVIDTLIITNNIMEDSRHGFNFICANYGNSQNKLQNVKFTGNTITNMQIRGIEIELVQADDEEKATESNLIANVEITQNTISQTWQGIYIGGGHQGSGVGANNNRIENVLIAENEIYGYTMSGVGLIGGESKSEVVSGNILDLITISENNIYQTVNQGSGVGLSIVGALSSNGSSLQNLVRIYVLNNRISKNGTGIQVFGGDGPGAEDNQVILAKVQGNILIGNSKPWEIRDNINGAVNNLVTGTVTTPTFSPPPGIYTAAIDVSLSCEIPGATIRFTTDESTPTEASPIYASPIRIDTTTTIKTRAYLNDWTPSEVATAIYTIDIDVAVEGDDLCEIPKDFALFQNYPNPFNPETQILFQIPEATEVEIKIYNLMGEEICTLLRERRQPGIHLVRWDGTYEKGTQVESGIYLYQMTTAQYLSCKKLLLIK